MSACAPAEVVNNFLIIVITIWLSITRRSGQNTAVRKNLVMGEDLIATTVGIEVVEVVLAAEQKCFRPYVVNVKRIVKFRFVRMAASRFSVVFVLVNKVVRVLTKAENVVLGDQREVLIVLHLAAADHAILRPVVPPPKKILKNNLTN